MSPAGQAESAESGCDAEEVSRLRQQLKQATAELELAMVERDKVRL